MGETRVDLQHLLEDLRDAYSGALEETILTEVVANALDSGAAHIRIVTNAAEATLTVADDGRGMQRRELARYHDVAASTKSRGEGIGFAGVGIKLGLLVSREVVTETQAGRHARGDAVAPGVQTSRPLEVDPAAWLDRDSRHRSSTDLGESALAAPGRWVSARDGPRATSNRCSTRRSRSC